MALRTDDSASSGLTSKRRRRVEAHALQRAQHFGQHVAPGDQRQADLLLAFLQILELAGDVLDVLAELALGLGGLDQRRGDAGVILLDAGDLAGQAPRRANRTA